MSTTTYAELEEKVKQKKKRNEIWKQLLQKIIDLRRVIAEKQSQQEENLDELLETI